MRAYISLFTLVLLSCSDGASMGLDGAASSDDAGPAQDASVNSTDAGPTGLDGGATLDAQALDAAFVDAALMDAEVSDAGGGEHPPVILPSGASVSTARFSSSEVCADCHSTSAGSSAMQDSAGRAIGPSDLWQSSMKANATRDPFFRAVMSAEIAATPAAKAVIEAKCFTCHGPMATVEAQATTQTFALDDLYMDSTLTNLAIDGVSCTACHQITDQDLGTPQSFSGHYVMGAQKEIYGPHAAPFANPMVNRSGFTPVRSDHMLESSLCATCHTLHTDAVDAQGVATGGRLLEQSPYLEWRNSSFTTEVANPGPQAQSCQGCHMPVVDEDGLPIRTAIARTPGGGDFPRTSARAPFGRHTLVGGNTLVPAMLRDNAQELNPKASSAAFDATITRARQQLNSRTARLTVQSIEPQAGLREVTLMVENLAGHKLPTAYPSRRVWLHVSVIDQAGQSVYETGGYDARGRLLGPDGAVLPSEQAGGPLLAHQDRIEDPAQPQVWQSTMSDEAAQPTFTLLRGASYAKDNRLLPLGWRPEHPDGAATAPVGTTNDPSFVAGADQVTVVVPAPPSGHSYSLQAELLYQVISPRWVQELSRFDTAEVAAFVRYWQAADVRPEVLASVESTVD